MEISLRHPIFESGKRSSPTTSISLTSIVYKVMSIYLLEWHTAFWLHVSLEIEN